MSLSQQYHPDSQNNQQNILQQERPGTTGWSIFDPYPSFIHYFFVDELPRYQEAKKQIFGQDTQAEFEPNEDRSDKIYSENKSEGLYSTTFEPEVKISGQSISYNTTSNIGDSEIYDENRFGELGRRDTELNNHTSLKDKIKGV